MENLNQDNLLTNQTALETNQTESVSKFMILDTAYFIRMKPLEHNNGFKYYTTDFIVREIRDEKAREFYELNKSFIQTKNPSRDVMRIITTFSKLSNDLKSLSIADLSIIALGYELCKEIGFESLLRKEPLKYEVVETVKAKEKVKEEKLVEVSDDGFVEVKSKGKKKLEKEMKKLWDENDEGEWITKDNIDSKLNKFKIEEGIKEEKESPINVIISTADFTIQNVSLKLGIPVLGVDGMKIRKIKNYILKCCTCNNFIFDTTKLFCEDCGYNLLMKLACSINSEGILKIYDKKVEARNRGTQVKVVFYFSMIYLSLVLIKKESFTFFLRISYPKKELNIT